MQKNSIVRFKKKQLGFTLIELIITMVVLGVLAVGALEFVRFSAQAYVDTVDRTQYTNNANIINEKLSRKLRSALPNSIRINNDGSCIEWLPILAASEYRQAPILGSAGSDGELHVVPLSELITPAGYAAIYPSQSTGLLYTHPRNPGMISLNQVSYDSQVNNTSVYTLDSGFRFEQASPSKRVYFISEPNAFCQIGSQLFWYGNYGFVADISNLTAALPNTLPNRKIIGANLLDDSLQFYLEVGSLRRNSIVSFKYALQESQAQENLIINREVQIRNVP